ncbi:sensor histidine kinase [Actinokineospora globicatena]|uniref:sensor histidine kinase n=1 Tax=Actinokineospora globicatena TaxID=103729 RepID=UPI0020A31DE4|nr:histidine kinase [Actinokineospora globicatena]MCP2305345.1 Signal transduction histidine kinase [Actinokineospora globicatena]GLW80822.1 two-component sensor histidine kinase [Actinokineospora globicatena]GLW87649.1 two-component sensor histidine kinase [Actinokineospora globicatena]
MREPLWRSKREAFFYLLPAAVVLVLQVAAMIYEGSPDRAIGYIDGLVAIAMIGLLVVRKWYPVALMLTTLVVSSAYLLLEWHAQGDWKPDFAATDPWMPASAPIYVYTAMVYAGALVGPALVLALFGLVVRPWDTSTELILGTVLLVLLPALIGLYVRAHRTLVQALTDRAERAEREQHLLAEQARADERVRLAEEMHDVVTHRVSLMVLHAGALAVTGPDERTKTAAEGLRVAGCEALNELRELVGVLRNETSEHQPRETVDEPTEVPDLSTLVSESESVGVPVELVRDGNPARISAAVSRTAYRVVQESLTNIRKHAPGAPTKVHVRYSGDRVRLTVRNATATQSVDSGLSSSGSGSGLTGLRQRVELVGGTLTSGPLPSGGFEVDAVLPAYVPTPESV